jgi:hypothetical protein
MDRNPSLGFQESISIRQPTNMLKVVCFGVVTIQGINGLNSNREAEA